MDPLRSTSEDYRGVIDDLTVENQNLKQRLNVYERDHCSHLRHEKLFEIRVHGLSPCEKRKLEETLRNFVVNCENPLVDRPQSPAERQPSPVKHLPPGDGPKVASSTTSNHHPPDSGYASMSTPRKASKPQSHHLEALTPSEPVLSSRQNIKSYLQDIPRGLLPKHPRLMTERSRKKLIVQRLEQLFTGKGATLETHSQFMQQQEVSESAARADSRAAEAGGRMTGMEGHREAKILPQDSEDLKDPVRDDRPALRHPSSSDCEDLAVGGMNRSGSVTPDQRPTRPLELDPCRAQVPADNIDYIRHLGMATPDSDMDSPSQDHSRWVYLNLLVGMAQLHTLNVTPEFVRKAVAEVSDTFELSSDGSKIRWKGGCEGTKMSSDDNSAFGQEDESSADDILAASNSRNRFSNPKWEKQSGLRRTFQPTPVGSMALSGMAKTEQPASLRSAGLGRTLSYQPLFRHDTHSENEEDYLMKGYSYQHSSGHIQDSPASAAVDLPEVEDGPIIFYNGASFYTDLSREPKNVPHDILEYDKPTCTVLGCSVEGSFAFMNLAELKGSIDKFTDITSPGWLEEDELEDTGSLGVYVSPAAGDDDIYAGFAPIILEASGLGGIQPSDNFAVDVVVRFFSVPTTAVENLSHRSYVPTNGCLASRYPPSMVDGNVSLVPKLASTYEIRSEVVSAVKTVLSPSSLPPPSYAFLPLSSCNSESCDDESIPTTNTSHRSSSTSLVTGEVFASPRFLHSMSSETTCGSTDASSDDSSIDMLAQARMVDPDSVAAQEREFETHRALSSLESVPVGSESGATGARSRYSSSTSDDASAATSDLGTRGSLPALKRRRDIDVHLNDNVKRLRVN